MFDGRTTPFRYKAVTLPPEYVGWGIDEDGREEGPPRVGTEGAMSGRVKMVGHKEIKYHQTNKSTGR